RLETRHDLVHDRGVRAIAGDRPTPLATAAAHAKDLAAPRPQEVVRHLRKTALQSRERARTCAPQPLRGVIDEGRARTRDLFFALETEQPERVLDVAMCRR